MKKNSGIYTKMAIRIGTFLGSPLVGGYMAAKNFRTFGKSTAAKISLLLGLLSTILILLLVFYLPEEIMEYVPYFFIPLLHTAFVDIMVSRYQQEDIESFLEKEYPKESYWKAAGFGIVGSILVGAFAFVFAFFQPLYPGNLKEYGAKHHEIYFEEGVKASLPDSLAISLSDFGYFSDLAQATAHIGRRDEYYVITLPMQKQYWEDEQIMSSLYALKEEIKSKFETKNIIIRLHHPGFSEDKFEEI